MENDQRFKGQEAAATGLGFAVAVLSGEWKSWVINRVSSWGGMGWLRPQGPDLEDEQTLVNLAIEHAIRGLQDHLVAQKALQGFLADPNWHEIKVELAKNPRAHLDARHQIAFSRSQYSGLLPVNPDRVFDLFLRKFQALLTNNQGFLAVRSESRQQQEQVISALHGTSTEILAVLGKMQNTQLLGSRATDPLVNASAQERAWYDRLTGIRALIRSYNLNQAERDLDRLATEFSDQTRIELRFEFASLKAGLAYYQNRMLEAAQYYEEAFKVDPDRALAKLHRGHAFLLRDEPREALVWIDLSLQGDLKVDQREAALAHKANALHALKSVQALEDLETHALASSKELRLALMHHAEQVKDFARVRVLAEPVVESTLQDGDARFAVLEALALWQQLEDAVVASGFSNRDEVALAAATDEGLHKISRVIDVLAATQNTRLHALARQVRMGFWMRAEHRNDALERALEDADRIRELAVDPSHGARNEAMLHCRMNNLEALSDALVRIPDDQVAVGVAVASAQVLWDAGQPEEAFALLQRVSRPIPSDWLMPFAAMGVLLIQGSKNLPEAQEWVEGMRDPVGADHGLSLARALIATNEGRLEDAGTLFNVAITDPMEINRFLAREWYAKMLYNAGFVREAAVVLEPVITPTTDAPLLQLALQAAWEAYHYGTCMSALQALRAQGVRKRLNLYREGFILNFQGKLEPVLKVMEEWVVLEPDHASPGIHRAFVLVRLGRPREAVEEIKRALSVTFVGLEDLRASSGLLLQCGELDLAMAVAYRATRSYPDKADAHLDFVTALRSWSAPASGMGVGLESAVQVRSVITKHEQTWIITDDPWSDLTRNEYRSEHPLAQAMLGKQVGDQVSIPGLVSPVQELFEIVKIEHKYISLGRAHAAAFNTRFPEDQRLKMVPFAPTAPESIEVLKQVIQERSQVWVVLQNMLFEGQLPVAKIGILAKLSPYETWDVFLEHPPGVLVFVDHNNCLQTSSDSGCD